MYVLGTVVGLLSVGPAVNLASCDQSMNRSFEPFELVNTYGAFGDVDRERYEVILEGTSDEDPRDEAGWHEYELPCMPGDTKRRPCIITPYHLRLDWQMWFVGATAPQAARPSEASVYGWSTVATAERRHRTEGAPGSRPLSEHASALDSCGTVALSVLDDAFGWKMVGARARDGWFHLVAAEDVRLACVRRAPRVGKQMYRRRGSISPPHGRMRGREEWPRDLRHRL